MPPPSPGAALFEDVRFEVIPLTGIVEQVLAHLSPDDVVTVTASPRHGQEATLDVADALAAAGRTVVPHLAARMIRDSTEVDRVLARLADAGIGEVFVVGGDAARAAGDYDSALGLLEAMEERRRHHGHDLRVGIAGHPEPHPSAAPDQADAALRAKQRYAAGLVTQMCFDPAVLVDWIVDLRRRGVDIPVRPGVAGPVSTARLMRVGARIGVGDSLRILSRHRGGLRALMGPGTWTPDALLDPLLDAVAERTATHGDLGIAGLHLYTFNAVEESARWRRRVLRSAGDDEHRGAEHQT